MVFCGGHDFIMLLALQTYSTKLVTGYQYKLNYVPVLNITDTGRSDNLTPPHAITDDTFTPKNILRALNEVVDWKSLGVQLDISLAMLQEICVNNRGQVGDCKFAMVSVWLSSDKTCSWRKLIDALISIGLHALAEGIRKQYCPLYQGSYHD